MPSKIYFITTFGLLLIVIGTKIDGPSWLGLIWGFGIGIVSFAVSARM